ncbi:MAG: DUF4062 domain-containing protein [Acidobacteriota bacterium]|jgi:hypothetical protein
MNPVIPVFIASPSDVAKEREMTEAAVHALAPRLARLFGVTVVPLRWEQFAPISSYDATHPQVGILQRIEPFSIFVGIVWKRYGTPVPGRGSSGTEIEFEHALSHRDRISILSYFRKHSGKFPKDPNAREQLRKVKRLKERFSEEGLNWTSYDKPEQFESRIFGDLMEAALKLVLSGEPRKTTDFLKFFKFGSHQRIRSRPLLIVYPPVTDPGPGHHKPVFNWRDRLLPHVIYEDSKAIQDIEEAMRLIGREYKTVTTDSPDLDIAQPGDRVWVCLPRNRRAKRVLERLGDRVRFRFEPMDESDDRPELSLQWRSRDGEWFRIRSPLRRYLEHSNRPDAKKPWKPLYGYVYGRDYAVFARFRVPRNWDSDHGGEHFYHYFVGGIRGLGTWGVGHLIDHESSSLVAMAEQSVRNQAKDAVRQEPSTAAPDGHPVLADPPARDDVQLLLEVTYENFRITGVRDVSEKPKEYFEEHFDREHIEKKLAKRPDWLPDEPETRRRRSDHRAGHCASPDALVDPGRGAPVRRGGQAPGSRDGDLRADEEEDLTSGVPSPRPSPRRGEGGR